MNSYRIFCGFCDKVFTAHAPSARYCTPVCRLKASHKRAVARVEAAEAQKEQK